MSRQTLSLGITASPMSYTHCDSSYDLYRDIQNCRVCFYRSSCQYIAMKTVMTCSRFALF